MHIFEGGGFIMHQPQHTEFELLQLLGNLEAQLSKAKQPTASGLQHAGRGRIRSCYITLQHVGNPQHPLLPKDIHRGFREVKNCLSESQTNPLQPIDVAHVPTSTAKLYIYLPSDPITLSRLLVLFKDFGALFVQKNPNFLLLQDCGNAPDRDWR